MADVAHNSASRSTSTDRPRRRSQDDLAVLLGSAAAGDETAFVTLYDATSARCFGLALRLLRDEATAERVTRDAYVDLWEQSRSFDPAQGSAISWILGLVHLRAVTDLRSTQHTQRATTPVAAGDLEPALVDLSLAQRAAVTLAYFGGYTCAEIGRETGVSCATAEVDVRAGLGVLSRGR